MRRKPKTEKKPTTERTVNRKGLKNVAYENKRKPDGN